ncbi:hypothetical protein GCM10007301_32040 [Azorhizobium oxalatiphilum]|uniref:PIG-L family deacetylase n=1 Tax=Azorhizobium oxalatiphilum TaxID=980631 RepID=A0A917C481_9HYPH|nr:PIG-L family deacetylase [Azorhizobium oxalatiphilum]GGF69899.1 hypothetical protein GCM10007301_32040 [Azorhizobium oxalatiphilum]
MSNSASAQAGMRIDDALRRMADLPARDFADLGIRRLLVVAPHPDDESLGCGGLIAAACAVGFPVTIMVVSDGTGSHPNSSAYPADRLRQVRESETLAAAAELGVAPGDVPFLRLPDRFVPTAGPEADAAVLAITSTARSMGADTIAVTWQHDPHCDHQAAHALVTRAARDLPQVRVLAYPIWGLSRPAHERISEKEISGFRLIIGEHRAAKRRAVAAHASQITALIDDDPDGFRLTAEDLARFDRPHEIFLGAAP